MWECKKCGAILFQKPKEKTCPACGESVAHPHWCRRGKKKFPCPDCKMCQFCPDERCRSCRPEFFRNQKKE